jgi:imidazolonepropionase-like amidohydrolase
MIPSLMLHSRRLLVSLLCFAATLCAAQLAPELKQFVRTDAPVIALTHVKIIDGTGAPARYDQTIIISGGKLQSIGANITVPPNAQTLDLRGYTVIPGLVGMHNHLFYPLPRQRSSSGKTVPGALALFGEMAETFPRLYLAAGVTTMRTTGSVEPFTDLEVKRLIDSGKAIGPKINVTGPYFEGEGAFTPQMHQLSGPDDAREMVNFWADRGVGSYKAYMNITRAELAATVEAAHKRGLKVTGHLCSIGFREAADLGIDDLEHGLLVDTEFNPGKTPDKCNDDKTTATLAALDLNSGPAAEMIQYLVKKKVAVTSTLPVFEQIVADRPSIPQRVLNLLTPDARADYLANRLRVAERKDPLWPAVFKKEMEFERAFVKAGGMLLAGPDPTGIGGTIAGFGDHRQLELLVEAGFTPLEAIHIYTQNGAEFLGLADKIGTIAPGKQADIVVIKGDPATKISDIENVEFVFKDGVAFDSAKLIESTRGAVGIR